jgi:hypothetical protein
MFIHLSKGDVSVLFFSRDTATTCISHLSELIVALTKIAEVEIYRNASKYMKS